MKRKESERINTYPEDDKIKDLFYIKSEFDKKGANLLPYINLLPIAACVTDSKGYFKFVNRKYCDLYGYTSEELIDHHFTMVVPDAQREKLKPMHANFIESGDEMSREYEVLHKNGNTIRVFSSASLVRDGGERKKITFLQDITQWVKEKSEIAEESKAISTRLTVQNRALEIILHDIKNLIFNITLSSEMIEDSKDLSEIKDYNSIINRNGVAISKLLAEQSTFLQIENDNYIPNVTKVVLNSFFEDIHEEFENLLRRKSLSLKIDGSREACIETDIFCLKSIIRNMLKNAIEATPADTTIAISFSVDTTCKISMHNHGAIPVAMRKDFFEPYITGEHNSGQLLKSTGLGTYIMKKMTDILNGEIRFNSDDETGTEINISLPVNEN